MRVDFTPFDGATVPLYKGVHMVEASAGTGKTYSIAMLALRFIVEEDVAVEELLVVTYTRAATDELRGRIRERLLQARTILSGKASNDHDPALVRYCSTLIDQGLALKRLQKALQEMDRAPVFTIHGFCQRMLQEQPLESGQLFDMELCIDVGQIRMELVNDFWRAHLYDLSSFHCSLLLDSFSTPEELYESVKLVGVEDLIEPSDMAPLEDALQQVDASLMGLREWWNASADPLYQLFRAGLKQKMFKKQLLESFFGWWQQCEAFFHKRSPFLPKNMQWLGALGLLPELNGVKLRGDSKKEAYLADWPLATREVEAFLTSCKQAVLSLRGALALALQTGLRKELHERSLFSFDDLVLRLANSLKGKEQDSLRLLLGQRFKVALIDEFQDTDAAQYHIFSTLFGAGHHYLYLIGDPKQAIYKFRGADIYAYFEARNGADSRLTLSKNYRSNPRLVAAVNALFLSREDSFATQELFYHQVDAAKEADQLCLLEGDRPAPAMVYCSLDSHEEEKLAPWSSGTCQERLLHFVLSEIQSLIGQIMVTGEGTRRKVKASDIAILVRNHRQAEAYRQVLAEGNIPCVLSSNQSVFRSGECEELQWVLEAVAVPSDTGLLRRALSCSWFGYDGPALYSLFHSDEEMEGWLARLYVYHQLWKDQGLLTMMNQLLEGESVIETLAAQAYGQRKIANIYHLLEVIQEEESSQRLVPIKVLHFIKQQQIAGDGGDAFQLRLESDAEAVRIATMHGVKGLEFPIVFCPLLWSRTVHTAYEKHCIRFHDEKNRQVADLGSSRFEQRRNHALQEELAEELRLLYVAVTRGSCQTYICWADVKGHGRIASSKESALAWVLSLADCKDVEEQNKQIAALCDGEDTLFRRLPAVTPPLQPAAKEEQLQPDLAHRNFGGFPLAADWLMNSYSGLAGSGYRHAFPSSASQKKDGLPIYELPTGANFGNVVHGILEDYSFTLLAGDDDYPDLIEEQCTRFGVSADTDQLTNLLRDITRSPLTAGETGCVFSLKDLKEADLIKEMPFYFHLQESSTQVLNEVLSFSPVVHPVQEKTLKGYLTGFVDLVCRYQGKYFVVDYKSNYLGDSLADYDVKAMERAMLEHNYGLQYWIYSLVLHKFLANSVAEYWYETHFGGVFYLFARGMRPDRPGNGVFFDRPDENVLDQLLEGLGGI